MKRIAIIGSGPTGIYTLKGLLASLAPLSITIIEAAPDPGKGTPYHPDINDPDMLSNIPSIEIPLFCETLVDWLKACSDEELSLLRISRENIDEQTFYPRVVLGTYMQAQFNKLCAQATACGHDIVVLAGHRVIDAALQPSDIRLTVKNGEDKTIHMMFDHTVMATGHNWPDNTEIRPGYFVSPWPAKALKSIVNKELGILGTSLSGIDALMSVATLNGIFYHDEAGLLNYKLNAATDGFHVTLMSRKGLLPEADFYCPLPYERPHFCNEQALDALIGQGSNGLLDKVFELFRQELVAADPAYSRKIGLALLDVETFASAYYAEREQHDPFDWAAKNLAEAMSNYNRNHTVAWRYAILITHEIIERAVPYLNCDDLRRFNASFKNIFVDEYATVPHLSIQRILAMQRAGALDIFKLGSAYTITCNYSRRIVVENDKKKMVFDAFVDATGQHALSATDLPFPSLLADKHIKKSAAPEHSLFDDDNIATFVRTGGIDIDDSYRPVMVEPLCNNLYCAAIPFLLHKHPFMQGITSSAKLGREVSASILRSMCAVKPDAPRHFA
jgi:uncharacterized NAD(P)/FAD-binding protein YdhS